MNIKQKILLLLMLATSVQAYAAADARDSLRCSEQILTMTAAEDGCSGAYCTRRAFVCLPTRWWDFQSQAANIPSNEKAPLVVAFHGRGKEDLNLRLSNHEITPEIKAFIENAPEAGMFAAGTNLHGAMPSAIVIYFQGLPTTPSWAPAVEGQLCENNYARGWQANPGTDLNTNRDLKFVEKFLTTAININGNPLLLQNYIDKKAVYAVGHSNGARFVGVLWNHSSTSNPLQRSNLKAAAFSAAQAGDFPDQGNNIVGQNLFDQADPLSIFMGMGRMDSTVDFAIQQQSIAQAQALLGTGSHPDKTFYLQANETVELFSGESGLKLATYIHPFVDETGNGHIWPAGQEKKIAKFFGLQPLQP